MAARPLAPHLARLAPIEILQCPSHAHRCADPRLLSDLVDREHVVAGITKQRPCVLGATSADFDSEGGACISKD